MPILEDRALNDLLSAAAQFVLQGEIVAVEPYGSGNVHDTYLVTLAGAGVQPFILQRINTHVFRRPELITANMRALSDHVEARLARDLTGFGKPVRSSERPPWVTPRILPTRDGKDYWMDASGAFWRAQTFVPSSRCYLTVQGIAHAREAGYALGRFHSMLADMDPAHLHDTLEGFHVTPRYLAHYDRVLSAWSGEDGPEIAYGRQFIAARRAWAFVLEDARERGELVLRPIHGDPKIDNIMIDKDTGLAVSIVDLDTVKPGLIHYDIGDCLRSSCNPLGEETLDLDAVRFDLDLCRAILEGYLSVAAPFLSPADYAYIYDAIRLIAFELGLRFFTDHLEGNVYFKARHARHNLDRALVQFRLTESIEAQEAEIRAVIAALQQT